MLRVPLGVLFFYAVLADTTKGLEKIQVATASVTPPGPVVLYTEFRHRNGKTFTRRNYHVEFVYLSYRSGNPILRAMTPWPNEPTAAQLQHLLKIIINDLLNLYDNGIVVQPAEYPDGRRNLIPGFPFSFFFLTPGTRNTCSCRFGWHHC
jgi:hypothetical protein